MVIKYEYVYNGETFECASFDDLIHLDNYHDIVYIDCYNNKLTVLPTLPNELIRLYCHYNNLTFLPSLPNSLITLDCYNNRLTFIPKAVDRLEFKEYHNNPVNTYILDKCGGDIDVYHRENEIFSLKLVNWYLDCRENPKFKFCRDRINKDYDALMEEDINGIIIGGIMA